jgi:hypothetical protein
MELALPTRKRIMPSVKETPQGFGLGTIFNIGNNDAVT